MVQFLESFWTISGKFLHNSYFFYGNLIGNKFLICWNLQAAMDAKLKEQMQRQETQDEIYWKLQKISQEENRKNLQVFRDKSFAFNNSNM